MLTSCLAVQNIAAQNAAVLSMMTAADRIQQSAVNNVSFGSSQPLKPSLASAFNNELMIKANETKVSVLQHLINALNKKSAANIKNSQPKFSGINYLA